jgi:hypothetical protein
VFSPAAASRAHSGLASRLAAAAACDATAATQWEVQRWLIRGESHHSGGSEGVAAMHSIISSSCRARVMAWGGQRMARGQRALCRLQHPRPAADGATAAHAHIWRHGATPRNSRGINLQVATAHPWRRAIAAAAVG